MTLARHAASGLQSRGIGGSLPRSTGGGVKQDHTRPRSANFMTAALGDTIVRAALLSLALAIGITAAFLLIKWARNRPPPDGLDRPQMVVLSHVSRKDPTADYRIEIHRDGRAIFEGGPEVLLPGRRIHPTSPQAVADLFAMIDESRFRRLKPRYSTWLGGDLRSTICLHAGPHQKCVDSFGWELIRPDAPEPFGEIAAGVDKLVPARRWLTADARTIDVFREEGIDPRSVGGQRLVVQAAGTLSPESMQALIAAGFPIDRPARAYQYDPGTKTPLEMAVSSERLDMTKILASAGALEGVATAQRVDLVVDAAISCQPEILRALLASGARFDLASIPSDAFRCKASYSEERALAVAKLLLDHGAPPNARNVLGRTPLHEAYSPAVAQLLIKRGADPNASDLQGLKPLRAAESEDMAITLVRGGADIGPAPSGAPAEGSIDAEAARKGWTRLQALLAQRRGRAA
ncbi:hypothetical protein DDF62_06310 [Caulobacter radicis]|uniref:ankyrin repeat domain-containing protein n=1 Tax=Caulobacter radicis TaxID=2172650 RepID=UPI000D573826|nr:ankyrin repeat domain-containing protein [Caulobacter radicis]PVM91637.1 hypothetical protein DDF62_06310 [Caulobacter radicis]